MSSTVSFNNPLSPKATGGVLGPACLPPVLDTRTVLVPTVRAGVGSSTSESPEAPRTCRRTLGHPRVFPAGCLPSLDPRVGGAHFTLLGAPREPPWVTWGSPDLGLSGTASRPGQSGGQPGGGVPRKREARTAPRGGTQRPPTSIATRHTEEERAGFLTVLNLEAVRSPGLGQAHSSCVPTAWQLSREQTRKREEQ